MVRPRVGWGGSEGGRKGERLGEREDEAAEALLAGDGGKMSGEDEQQEQTIAEDLVVTKYKMGGDIANRECAVPGRGLERGVSGGRCCFLGGQAVWVLGPPGEGRRTVSPPRLAWALVLGSLCKCWQACNWGMGLLRARLGFPWTGFLNSGVPKKPGSASNS